MNKVIVQKGQSLLDISVQVSGTIENVFVIAKANELSITDELPTGMELLIPEGLKEIKRVKNYYKQHNIIPGTWHDQ